MDSMLLAFFTYVFAFLLRLMSKLFRYEQFGQYDISNELRKFFRRPQHAFWSHSSSEDSRIKKAARILESVKIELLDRNFVEEKYAPGTWQRKAYDNFTSILVAKDKTFPCIYATKGYKANEIDFVFLDSEDLDDIDVAKVGAKAMLEYHKTLRHRGRNLSLVLLCPPPTVERSVDEYHELFWSFLKRLRQLDPKPWPANIPQDTLHRKWCMNFDATEAFFAVQTPAHKQRLSRFSPNLAMIYQPRCIFDIIFKDTWYRESATKTVRGLVDKYDKIPHSPDISDYAVEGTTESRQYFLLDKNEPAQCPYNSLDTAALAEAFDVELL